MPDSAARRSVSGPIWRAVQLALAALLGSAVLFIGITRTQVGRSGIRDQLERAFNERFQGTLSIGTLKGSVIDDVVATDVRLLDPSGDLVAAVDSVVAEPRWANLLTSELSVRSIEIVAPQLTARRDSSGTWSLAQALRSRHPTPASRSPLDLTLASITVRDGQIATTRSGRAPSSIQNGWLFDYTRTELSDLSLQASVERTGPNALISVTDGSFSLAGPAVGVSSLEGQLLRRSDGWSVNDLDLSLDTTRIRGYASVRSSASTSKPTYSVHLNRSRIDNDELRRLVPRASFADVVTVEGDIEGTSTRLSVNRFEVTHNTSFASLRGSVAAGDTEVRVDLSVDESTFQLEDVREVWPDLPAVADSSVGPLTVSGSLEGTANHNFAPQSFDLRGQMRAESQHGAVRGSLDVRSGQGDSLRYSGSLHMDSLNVEPFSRDIDLTTAITGDAQIEGRGLLSAPGRDTLTLALSPLRIGARSFASANGTLTIEDGAVNGQMSFRQPDGGLLDLEGGIDSLSVQSRYRLRASTSEFDLSPNGGLLPSTRLNARLALRGSGLSWKSLTGTAVVSVDSSRVLRGDSSTVLPAHSMTLRLADRTSNQARVELSGSVAAVRIDGTTLGPPLWSAARTWSRSVGEAISRELDKPAPSPGSDPVQPFISEAIDWDSVFDSNGAPASRENAAAPAPVEASAHVRVHRSDILRTWWSAFPKRTDDLLLDASLTMGPDSIHTEGVLSADRVAYPADSITDLAVEYDVSAHHRAPLAETMQTEVNFSAESIDLNGIPVSGASGSLSYTAREGSLRVQADNAGIIGPVELVSDIRVTPTKNELRVRKASIGLRGDEWENKSPSSVRAYSNALVVTPLVLERPHPQTPDVQRIRIGGTLSARPADTLAIETQHLALAPFSRALDSPKLIGGNLSGQLYVASTDGTTQMGGALSVRRLSYDRRVLGDGRLGVEYSATSPTLRVGASLKSTAPTADSLSGADVVAKGARTVEPNDLTLSGRVRLPHWAYSSADEQQPQLPAGETLDVNVDVERADLFFFRYIFEQRVADVRGYAAGTVHVGGQFRNPIFDADLTVENGSVRLPRFGLQYALSGPLSVDRQGIHLQDISVRDDEGSATVTGSIFFNEYRYFSFDLSGTLDELTVIDVSRAEALPFYGHIRASGPATLTGPLPDATLRSSAATTTPESELFIPVSGETVQTETGFIVFADSTGQVPDLESMTRRSNILADRPEGQPTFVEGLNIDINVTAPEGSTVNLVFDPVVGDVVTAVGSGRVQLQRQEGDFRVFGNFSATSGTYLFTAGEVFVRRFSISDGTITWDGDPINAQLDLAAEYRTRASPSGLPGYENYRGRIPVTVQLDIEGRVATPRVNLNLALAREERGNLVGSETLDAILNEPALRTEYATSVLLTNTFLLTTESIMQRGGTRTGGRNNRLTAAGNQLAFNSVSQLVSSQLNRYLGAALPNVDLNFGVQGEDPNDLDLIYGVALRLLNERLVIRGEGVYTGDEPDAEQARGPQGEFVVEVRLSSNVSAKVFYRRTGDELTRNQALTSSRGAGLSFRTVFSTWSDLLGRLFGWLLPADDVQDEGEPASGPVADQTGVETDSSATPNRRQWKDFR